MHEPRHIYVSAVDRRSAGRRWTRRRRSLRLSVSLLAGTAMLALVAGELLRAIG